MKHTFLTLLFAIVVNTGTSSSAVVGGIGYVFDSDNLTAYVTGLSVKYSGSITIPSSVSYSGKTYNVTGINSAAFQDCSDLTSITIPYSVTSIGRGAFRGCSSLTSMVVAEENIVYDSRSNCNAIIETSSNTLIAGCKNTLIPNSVTEIGNSALEGCSSLTSIEIPNSVTNIGYQAFYHCTSLTSVIIPNSVTSIGSIAFSGCSSLTSVTIPNSVTSIGYAAFRGCSSLTTPVYNAHVFAYMPSTYSGAYSILDGIESIAGSAFSGCTNLTSINIPNSVTNIGQYAFSGCTSLPVVDNLRYADTYLVEAVDKTLSSYTIKNGTKWIESSAFSGCSSLTSIEIPNSVTSIGYAAFRDCINLTSVTIPNSVTSIGGSAFSGCSGLTSVTLNSNTIVDNSNKKTIFGEQVTEYILGDEITSIGNFAFNGCSSLTSVTIGNSVTSIGYAAFRDCINLTSVTIPNSVTNIRGTAFQNCSSLTSVTLNSNTIVDNSNIKSIFGEQVTEYILGDEITSIGSSAFSNCSSLTSVTIPNSVTSIGENAFYGCSGLTSVTIPNSVTSIGNNAFSGCSGLTSVTIGNSVTSIGRGAFSGCSNLTSVTIPNSVTSIGWNAFYNCSGLTSVTIPNSVTSIGYAAFADCSSLTSVTIPNSVTSIGNSAFEGCSGLTSVTVEAGNTVYDSRNNCNAVIETSTNTLIFGCQNTTIPNSVTSIGEGAFVGCSSLTSVTIPNSVTSIGYAAFYGCSSLTSVTIPSSVTSIGDFAFYRCSSLTSVTIPNNVTSIGEEAFSWCSSLTSVTIPNSVTSIGDNAFYNCSSLTSIYVPCGEMERFKQLLNNDSRINDHAPLPYTITIYATNGNVTYPQTICDDMLLNATPDYGYHFVKWSDGNTDNPRTIELRQDTTLEAIFAVDKYGTCGDNLQLTWRYDTGSQTLTISGEGDLTTNMRYGVEAVKEMKELVIEDGVGVIGNEAFANIKTLNTITLGKDVRKLQERVFYNCYNLTAIYNYRKTPASATSNTFEEVDKYACTIYVLAGSEEMFRSATGWKDFYSILAIGAEEATVTTNDVKVEPQDNAATLTWPTSNEAFSYTIEITKDGVVFCRLTFNANGQLTGIAFAPGRDGQSMAPAAIMTANGLQFTVTGLNSGTQYGYSLTANDANEQPIATYSGSFTTTSEGVPTGIDNTPFLSGEGRGEASKLLRNGEVLILRDGKTYTIQGVEVK